jgi:hypothetical protein
MAVKTWVWVVVALVGVVILGLIALVGAGAYFVAREFDARPASKATAQQQFEEARARFGDAKPVIEIDEEGRAIKTHINPDQPPAPKSPDVMVVMAWDPDEERVVRVRLPFWLLRLGSHGEGGQIRLGSGGSRIDFERLHVSIGDLERLGPALILDHTSRRGERVLIWTQ